MAETSVTFGFRLDPATARCVKEAAAAAGQDTSRFLRELVRRGLDDSETRRAVIREIATLRSELNGMRSELASVRAQMARDGVEFRGLVKKAVAGLLMATARLTEDQAVRWVEDNLDLK